MAVRYLLVIVGFAAALYGVFGLFGIETAALVGGGAVLAFGLLWNTTGDGET